jgi:hypothetical protein
VVRLKDRKGGEMGQGIVCLRDVLVEQGRRLDLEGPSQGAQVRVCDDKSEEEEEEDDDEEEEEDEEEEILISITN